MTKQLELTYYDLDAEYICTVFGLEEKGFDMMVKSMKKFFGRLKKADNKPQNSKTASLKLYLESEEFKNMNFPLTSANAYFLLGYIFAVCINGDNSFAGFLSQMAQMQGHHMHQIDEDDDEDEEDLVN